MFETSAVQPSPEAVNSYLADYEFPASIDPAKRYLFYLHGKIIEEQGLPAVSPDFRSCDRGTRHDGIA